MNANKSSRDPTLSALAKCGLLAGVMTEELAVLAASAHLAVRAYPRGAVIAFEEDACDAIGVVVDGSVHIQRIYPSGKVIVLETVRAGESFGEALLFTERGVYPATLIAPEDTLLVFIAREDVLAWMARSPLFLRNMLRSLSNRILLLNRRIKGLSLGSVRQRVANYILEESARQASPRIELAWSRDELAGALGIPRPSLSRELVAMKADGWIDFDRKTINVIERVALEGCLGE
jgi:CRP-like cAMP-binding protein